MSGETTPQPVTWGADYRFDLLFCAQISYPISVGGAEYKGGISAKGNTPPRESAEQIHYLQLARPGDQFLGGGAFQGDRRVADVIEQAWRHGAKFDSWSEYFSLQTWLDAFAACGLSPCFLCQPYTGQGRDLTLADHFRRRKGELSLEGAGTAYAGQITPDCR